MTLRAGQPPDPGVRGTGATAAREQRPPRAQGGPAITIVVEDDPDYADIISYTLKRESHEVVVFDTAAAAVAFAAKKPLKLAVLDVMLPDATGLELCNVLRRLTPNLPILFLSSLDTSSDVVAGLHAGGDDYMTKPFHPSELAARAQALVRRAGTYAGQTERGGTRLSQRGLEADRDGQEAYLDGKPLGCTPFEVEILAQLLHYPGQALSHGFLTQQVWGYSNVQDASLLKGHISSLRKKVKDGGGSPDLIRTVHGVGYSYTPL